MHYRLFCTFFKYKTEVVIANHSVNSAVCVFFSLFLILFLSYLNIGKLTYQHRCGLINFQNLTVRFLTSNFISETNRVVLIKSQEERMYEVSDMAEKHGEILVTY